VNRTLLPLYLGLLLTSWSTFADTIYVTEEQLLRVSQVQAGKVQAFANNVGLVYALDFDHSGNLFAADSGGDNIYKITSAGTASVFASGSQLGSPTSMAFDGAGNLYTSGAGWGGTINRISSNGTITPFASGVGGNGLAFDASGNLFASSGGSIVKITPSGAISTFASGFGFVWGIAFDKSGNLFAADYYQSTISKITPGGTVSLFTSQVDLPTDLAFDSSGNLFVCNITESQPLGYLNKITPYGTISRFANGLNYPTGIAILVPEPSVISLAGGCLFIALLKRRLGRTRG
jgi:sugar lactone lactonase YvrE